SDADIDVDVDRIVTPKLSRTVNCLRPTRTKSLPVGLHHRGSELVTFDEIQHDFGRLSIDIRRHGDDRLFKDLKALDVKAGFTGRLPGLLFDLRELESLESM